MSSQRNRPRGPNRNSEAGKHGEEVALWQSIYARLQEFCREFNDSNANVGESVDTQKRLQQIKDKGVTAGDVQEFNGLLGSLDANLRAGVKINDKLVPKLASIIEDVKILRAMVKANEEAAEQTQSLSRSATQRAKESAASSSVYDFDGAGDSPVPSPNPNISRRMGGSKGDRDSVPPKLDRSTPGGKAGSVEPQAGSSSSASRSKMTFAVHDEVAFKPKQANAENTDWILGIVQEVKGEGKSRRYKVLDADPDEAASSGPKEFRTSASNMILIPKEDVPLPPLDSGKTVLALYPNTTTFYKAEVMGMTSDGKVNLRFDGEESNNVMQSVVRRMVVEYRG